MGGPAGYDIKHDLTEMRMDKGAIKMKPPKEQKEFTALNPDLETQAKRPDIYPDFDYDKPKKLTHMYKDPVEQAPTNIPDKALKPEHWKFYDGDLDAVREVGPKPDFAQNMDIDEFVAHEEYVEARAEFQHKDEKMPEAGDYHPKKPQEKVPGGDFWKGEARDPFQDADMDAEFDREGDVLVLNGDKPKPHLPGINLDKK